MEINRIEILSVGVDIGSSTSHLVFSNLLLKRDERSVTRRFNIQERNIVYEGRIVNTPLLDDNTIDIDRLTDFFKKEYIGRFGFIDVKYNKSLQEYIFIKN